MSHKDSPGSLPACMESSEEYRQVGLQLITVMIRKSIEKARKMQELGEGGVVRQGS